MRLRKNKKVLIHKCKKEEDMFTVHKIDDDFFTDKKDRGKELNDRWKEYIKYNKDDMFTLNYKLVTDPINDISEGERFEYAKCDKPVIHYVNPDYQNNINTTKELFNQDSKILLTKVNKIIKTDSIIYYSDNYINKKVNAKLDKDKDYFCQDDGTKQLQSWKKNNKNELTRYTVLSLNLPATRYVTESMNRNIRLLPRFYNNNLQHYLNTNNLYERETKKNYFLFIDPYPSQTNMLNISFDNNNNLSVDETVYTSSDNYPDIMSITYKQITPIEKTTQTYTSTVTSIKISLRKESYIIRLQIEQNTSLEKTNLPNAVNIQIIKKETNYTIYTHIGNLIKLQQKRTKDSFVLHEKYQTSNTNTVYVSIDGVDFKDLNELIKFVNDNNLSITDYVDYIFTYPKQDESFPTFTDESETPTTTTTTESKTDKKSNNLPMIIGIAGGIVVLVIIYIFYFRK
tara:strand:+ start:3 stop:1370 length:1368 start_codon:yes stop_codon:yes gene_type:complete